MVASLRVTHASAATPAVARHDRLAASPFTPASYSRRKRPCNGGSAARVRAGGGQPWRHPHDWRGADDTGVVVLQRDLADAKPTLDKAPAKARQIARATKRA